MQETLVVFYVMYIPSHAAQNLTPQYGEESLQTCAHDLWRVCPPWVQHAANDLNTKTLTDLAQYITYTRTNFAFQNFVAVLWNPNNVITMMKNCVSAGCVAHSVSP